MILLLLLLPALAAAKDPDYFDNALAKVCRPLDKNLDLMFLLDGSGSVSGNTFDTQLRMVKRVIEQVGVDVGANATRIAILQYSGYTKTEVKFGGVRSNQELLEKLKNIRHISGTTRTGKALRRARNGFSESQGARLNDPTVAQVVVVVGDGHSLDNPIPAARELREKGIVLLTMGIGAYVNMNELIEMTEDPSMAFSNETMDEFISTFRRIAVGEICDFAKGTDGAEIVCGADAVEVNIMTQKPFHGHVYVPDYFKNPNCVVSRGNVDERTISLRIPLDDCGVQEQFLFSPRGLLAESSVVLMYHPEYNSPKDKTFNIRCFYPDMRYHGKEGQEIKHFPHFDAETLKIEGNPLIASFPVPKMEMPCAYTLRRPDRSCVLEDAAVGDSLVHQWECDKSIIGDDYGFHIHSCFMTDGKEEEMLVLDADGCPVDESLFSRVDYDTAGLRASAKGSFVKFADGHGVKFRCSVRFCNLEEGECETLLAEKCGEEVTVAPGASRAKRQVMDDMKGFMPPQMVERLFMRRQKQQESSNSTNTSNEVPKDRFGRPLLQTFDNSPPSRRLGLPSVRAFRPIGVGTRARILGNVTPKRVLVTTTKAASTTAEPTTTQPPTTEAPTTTTEDELALIAAAVAESLTSTQGPTTVAPTTAASTSDLPTSAPSTSTEGVPITSAEKEKPELPETAFKLSLEPSVESGPMMAGSFTFDELVAEAIEAVENNIEAEEEKEEALVSEDLYDDSTTNVPEATTRVSHGDSEDSFYIDEAAGSPEIQPVEDSAVIVDGEFPTTSIPDALAFEEELLEEDLKNLSQDEEAALEEELLTIEQEINDPALAKVVDDIRMAVKEGEMGMELVGLAVDIVAGLQLGQVQLESQLVRARPPPQNLPSPLNFCPRRL